MPVPSPSAPPAPARLASLDALRGFDMLWIVGGGTVARALRGFGDAPVTAWMAAPFEHVAWEGMHFEDLIFPLFVFIAGASLVFALTKAVEQRGRPYAARRVVVRAAILFAIGVIYSGGFEKGVANVRWLGVLQRIALAYLGAGLLFLVLKPRGLVAACVTLLLGYWALLAFVPVPGIGAGDFAESRNLANHLDRLYLPGRRYNVHHDPEGLLSTLAAIATCLLGVFAGLRLRREASACTARWLVIAGVLLLCAGWAWSPWLPVIKKIWTPSYVLVAGGWSAILLGLFHWMIDVRGWHRWTAPFIWIGLNPITIYLLDGFIDPLHLAQRFTGGDLQKWLNASVHPGVGDLLTALVALSFSVLLAWFLNRRKMYLRV
jgi:predicted acyltransferase